MTSTVFSETKTIFSTATPIAASTILEGSVYFLNTWMLAKLGADTLAAGALVTNLFSTLVMIMWGIFSSSSMLYSRYLGEGNDKAIAKLFSTSNILSATLGIFTGTILWNSHYMLRLLGQPPDTIQAAVGYAHGLALAEIPDLLGFSIFNFLQGIGRASATFWLSLLYVPLNLIANYVLVFGKLGLPAMGAAGIGYGTCFAYCVLLAAIIVYLLFQSELRRYCLRPFLFSWNAARELFQVGTPLGLVWALVYLFLFLIATLFGKVGTEPLAAYQIVSQWLGGFSLITLALSKVLSMRIGLGIGKRDRSLVLSATNAAVIVNSLYVLCLAILMVILPKYLIAFDLNLSDPTNQPVINYATDFFRVAFIYLFFDNLRFLYSGALLGLKDTMYLLVIGFVTWIMIGTPLVIFFSHFYPSEPIRIFEVMAAMEALGLLLLAHRYYKIIRNNINL